MLCEVRQPRDFGETDRYLSGCYSYLVGSSLPPTFSLFTVLISSSTLTGLPIMGAILGRQHNSTFMGLQVFAIATMFIGFVLLLISRNVLAAAHGTWKY